MKIRNLTVALAVAGIGVGLAACGTSGTSAAAPEQRYAHAEAPASAKTEVPASPATDMPAAAPSPTHTPAPAPIEPASLRAQLIKAGDDWVMSQLAMMSVHNPALSAVINGAPTIGDPKDNAMRTWSEAAPRVDAALAAETSNGTPDADLVDVLNASFTQWDLIMADHVATDGEMKDYVQTVNNPWIALGGLAKMSS